MSPSAHAGPPWRSASTHLVRRSHGAPLEARLLAFDASGFDAGLFRAAGIACPATIARSVPKRQAEFFFGRLAARDAMLASGLPGVEIAIGPSREPVWPTGVVGSITHTRGFAAAVVAPSDRHRGIGIDIEHVVGDQERAALQALAIGERELRHLRSLEAGAPLDTLMTLVFSAKESFFKAAFGVVRRYVDFGAATTTRIDLEGGWLTLVLEEDLHRDLPRGMRCEVSFDMLSWPGVFTSFVWQAPGAGP